MAGESENISVWRVFVGICSSLVVMAVGGLSWWVLLMATQVAAHDQKILGNHDSISEIKQAAIREKQLDHETARTISNIESNQSAFRTDISNIKGDIGDIKTSVGQILLKLNELEDRTR